MKVAPPRRPNLLWIMTDQQRADALSCHDGAARTPALDGLAQLGVDLRAHYAQSPVCVPSRCTLFTGRYPQAHHCRENDTRLPPYEIHLPKILQHAGYHLGYIGKNHFLPDDQLAPNFDYVGSARNSETPGQRAYAAFARQRLRRLRTHGVHGSAAFHDFAEVDTTTGRIGQAALDYLRAAPLDRPWFATVSFDAPHAPHLAPRRLAALYPEEDVALTEFAPANHVDRHPRFTLKRRAQLADRATAADRRRYLACYYAMCTFVDEQIDRLLGALQNRADAADTIVLFTSDHGDFNWHHGLGKKDLILCDELLHVPCLIAWPGRLQPQTIAHTFTEHADLVPTLLDLLGVEPPIARIQGRSFAPLLRGETHRHRDRTSATVCHPHQCNPYRDYEAFRADWEQHADKPGHLLSHTAPYNVPGTFTTSLRTRHSRYVWYADGFEELFDCHADPREWHNLAREAGHARALAEMRHRCLVNHTRLEDDPPRGVRESVLAAYPRWKH